MRRAPKEVREGKFEAPSLMRPHKSIQPHGLLFAAREDDGTVTQVSSNTQQLLGRDPVEFIGKQLVDVCGERARESVRQCVEESASARTKAWRLPVETVHGVIVFDGVAERVRGRVLLELEPVPETGSSAAALHHVSNPYFRFVRETLGAVGEPESLEETCEVLCREVRTLTGFDRVMVYHFTEDGHGEVLGEALDDKLDSRLGLHYPEIDIPAQARRGYAANWVEMVPDVEAKPAPLEPALDPETGKSLVLGQCQLSMPTRRRRDYLSNLGARAAMSLSLKHGDKLWGLVVCLHEEPRLVPAEIRVACSMLGAVASAHLMAREAVLRAERGGVLHEIYNRLITMLGSATDLSDGLGAATAELTELVDAAGVATLFEGNLSLGGETPGESDVYRLKEWLDEHQTTELFSTSSLPDDWSDLPRDLIKSATGLISLKFWPDDYLIFFRPEWPFDIRWAGDPNETPELDDAGEPMARESFEETVEHVSGRARGWHQSELIMARDLQSAISGFLRQRHEEVDRLNRQLAEKNEEVEELVYSVSHDLKSPLVTCQGFIGLLLEDLDNDDEDSVRDSANRVKRAATQMSRLIDDLLQHSRIGRAEAPREDVNTQQLLRKMKTLFAERLDQADATLTLSENIPPIHASPVDLERIFENLISNALKYACEEPGGEIEVGGIRGRLDTRFFVRDNGPGIEPQYHAKIFRLFQRLVKDKDGSGVGLASVSKIMTTYDGRAWVDSLPGEGATFWVSFPAERSRPKAG